MKEYTIKFNNWHSDGTTSTLVITFANDGQFTRNSMTSAVIPQNDDMFEETIKTYLKDKNNELISQ